MRAASTFFSLFASITALAQFPLVRSIEVRAGQAHPSIQHVVQDANGLLWVATREAVLRTDGELVEVMGRMESDRVVAMARDGAGVLVATERGLVMRMEQGGVDTLIISSDLRAAHVTCLVMGQNNTLWVGTNDHGLGRFAGGVLTFIDHRSELPDDHINDIGLLRDGTVVAATDQGLAICDEKGVIKMHGEREGAPDNLIFCVDVTDDGAIWAGTDARGIFRWDPSSTAPDSLVLPSPWPYGSVRKVAVREGFVWAGTTEHGPIVMELGTSKGVYRMKDPTVGVLDMFSDLEGNVWWCDGSELLFRADPSVLIVPEHEGLDLREISALCATDDRRLWLATPNGLIGHETWFSEDNRVVHVPLPLDKKTPIVSLATDKDGTLWAATFGSGVVALLPNGAVMRYTERDGISNNNVLAVRRGKNGMWFATLQGLTKYDGQRFIPMAKEAGFVFDVLELDGAVYAATDGNGVFQLGVGPTLMDAETSTYYSLVQAGGHVYGAGPLTGLCSVGDDTRTCWGAGRAPFGSDLHALGVCGGHVIAFGKTAVLAIDPSTGVSNDITAVLGLEDASGELNAATTDPAGALWLGCSKGLVRIMPKRSLFDRHIVPVILAATLGEERIPLDGTAEVAYSRNRLVVQFTGLNYVDPSAVRFEYRLQGLDGSTARTRDRQASFAALRPGTYAFQVRAYVGDDGGNSPWQEFTFTIAKPWWRTWWAVAAISLIAAIVLLFVLRARDRRIRFRDHMEKEKVRFQLEALRSQVDPHFLFNSFNALADLIENEPSAALEHVEQLSTFFRNALLVRDRDWISVGEELNLLNNYFELEERRYGEAITLFVDVDEASRAHAIVPLTLQLLVENAIKHNVVVRGREFRIEVRSEGDSLVVTNPLRPRAQPPRSTGFGLYSIVERYKALGQKQVVVDRQEDRFTVRIPLIMKGNEDTDRRG